MTLYFEFDDRRMKAEVQWPKDNAQIVVHLTDEELIKEMPTDLLFDIGRKNKVSFTIESPDNKRLIELQSVITRRLQEFANKL